MPQDLTTDSERLLDEGRALVRDNRSGGRHRRARSIGRGSAELRQRNLMTRIKLIGGSLLAIVPSIPRSASIISSSVRPPRQGLKTGSRPAFWRCWTTSCSGRR